MPTTSVAKKVWNGITGLGLALFVVFHLAGNLTLFFGAKEFNGYADFITHLMHGTFIYLAEAGLILFFLVHVATALSVRLGGRDARPQPYATNADAGGASRKSFSSKTMLVSGVLLFAYLVYHVKHFKFGPGLDEGYVTMLHGEEVRDMYRLVVEEFNKPLITFGYVAFMIFLGLHLRHGIWSAFQSVGATSRKLVPLLYIGGGLLAALLAAGFIALPLYIYFFIDVPVPPQ